MPTEVLYAIIGVLLAAVVALAGLWVRSHDIFRQWATAEFVLTGKELAGMKQSFADIRDDIALIRSELSSHAALEQQQYQTILKAINGARK